MPCVNEYIEHEPSLKAKWAEFVSYIYLEKNLLVVRKPEDSDYRSQEPIVVNKDYGIMVWSHIAQTWAPARKEIQEVYSNYIAEKILLEDECNS